MVLTYDEFKKKKKKEIEERNKKEYEKNSVSVSSNTIPIKQQTTNNGLIPINENLINNKSNEPKKSTAKNDDRTWFSGGAFSDGYQFGDVTKTILGTTSDLTENVFTGAIGIAEKTIDAGAYILGGGAKLFGNDNFANKTQKFIEKDLINEEKIAKGINTTTTHGMLNQFLNKGNTDEASVFGEKTDSLVQSGGQLAGTLGLQAVGVPWWLTTGVTSFGAETEQAFKQGATYGEAGFSGLVTAGAEMLTEKISGGIKFGGRTLDDGLQRLISEKITNKVLQTATKIGVDMVGEGTEEVLSELISSVGKKLSYEDEKTWDEMLTSEEAMDSYLEAFIGGAVLGGVGSATQRAFQQAEQDLGRPLTADEKTEIKKSVENASDTEIEEEIAPVKEQDDLPNSKVRDKDGKLLTVYHGTRAEFDTYDTSKAGQNYEGNWLNNGKGIYFTDNKEEAMEYAKSSIDKGSPKIKEAQLDITNPFDSSKDYTNELSEMAKEYGIEPYYLERGDRLFNWFNINKKDIVEALSKYGYDGIVDHGHYTVFDPKQIKNVENNKNIQKNIMEGQETAEDNNIEQDVDYKINSSMTMDEARDMLQRAFVLSDIKEYSDGAITNIDEWVNSEDWSYQIPMMIENDYNLQSKYINSNPDIVDNELYTIEDIIEAYKNGTLIGKEKAPTKRLDLSKDTNYKDDRFYAPQDIKGDSNLYNVASQRVTNNNRADVYKARADFIINAHNKGYIDSLGLTQDEVNKKLKSWANYTKKAMDLSNSFNEGVPLQNRWTGIENSSIVNTISISNEEMGKLVKEIKGDSSEWQRQYITSTMLALDTHIDYSRLTFEFEAGQSMSKNALGQYENNTETIKIRQAGQNTVAHEMGHYIDRLWAKELGLGKFASLTDRNINYKLLNEEQTQFVKNFHNFLTDIESTSDIGSQYKMSSNEVFARFVARFTEWTKNQATNNRYGYEAKWYKDNFNERQYREFVKILQEKALLDTTGQITKQVEVKDNQGRTLSQGQQEYFKDSKVRDEQGQLLTLYHGGSAKTEYTRGGGEHGKGYYFTPEYKYAESFAPRDSDVVSEVYLNLKNPLEQMYGKNKESVSKFVDYISETYNIPKNEAESMMSEPEWSVLIGEQVALKEGHTYQEVANFLGWSIEDIETQDVNMKAYLSSYAWEETLNDKARELGYDGIISRVYNDSTESDEYIAFNSNQIKAVDNTDPTNSSDIRYSLDEDIAPVDEDILPENNDQKLISKEWTDKVNEQNETNTPLAKEQAKATGHNTMIGYSPILSNYKLYSKGSLSWVTPEGKLNSKVIAETEIDSFLSKNKIDRLAGGINTFENGLSNQDIAPVEETLTEEDIVNQMRRLQETSKETATENHAPLSDEFIEELTKQSIEWARESGKLQDTKALAETQVDENLQSITDNDIAPVQEDTTPEYESNSTTIESPFDSKDMKEVGNQKVKAYQYENPEVKPFFKTEAEAMLGELENTVKGARMPIYDEVGNMEYVGVTRETTEAIAYLKDNYNYTYAEIEKGLRAIIEDDGKENIAVAKRIEFMLDERLRNGYTSIDGTQIPANQDYINLLHEKGYTAYNQEVSQGLTDEFAPVEEVEAPVETVETSVENASETQQVEEIAPVKEQAPTLKEAIETEDPVMKAVKNKVRKELEKTIGERRNELIRDDQYANNNIVIKKKPTLKESASRSWDAFQSHFVNRNRQIDKLSKASDNKEIKFKGDRVNNISGEIGGDIFTAQTDNYGNVIGKSLDAPFESARKEGLDTYFDNYLKHQSNIERHAQGKGSAKVSAEASKKYVKAYESKYPQFKEWAKDVYTYNQNLLDNAVQNGLIDDYFKNTLTTMYGKYVPFYEQNAEPTEYMTPEEIKTSRPIKRAKGGSDTNLLGIEQAMIQQTYAYKNAIAKNDLYKEIGSVMGKKVELGADLRTSPTQLDSTLYADENGKYLTYYDKGQQKTVQITDELYTELSRDLEHQIRNLEEKYSLITTPLQKISQIRGQILTTYNVGFVITNPFKDIQDALLNTKNLGKYAKNVLTQSTIRDSVRGKNVNQYATEFKKLTGKDITSIRDAKTLKGKARAIYKDWQAGTMWNRFITSYGTNSTSMEFSDGEVDVKAKNKGFLNAIERANNYMEVMFRYPEFKATLEKGGSFTEALYNAREVTTNFGRGGTISKAINRNGATFFNTSVQGMDKFFRNFSGENGARGFVGAVGKAVSIGMLPALLNHLLFDDDDEYEALPDYIKDNYYLFKTGYGEYIRIPKGRMISVLGSSARRTLELADGEKDAFEGFLKNTSDQIGATNPLDENIFSPIVQAVNNEAWYGGDLVPTRLQNKPTAEQYDEGTDEFSKWLGKQLNISPYKINYVIDQYSGGFGDLILPMITEEAKSDGTLLAPLKDKFTVNSTDDNKYVGELYDLSEEFTIKSNGENASEEDILKNKYLNSIKSQMSELYKEKREIQSSDISKEAKYERVKVVQNQINALAKEGLDFHTEIETTDNYATVGYYGEYYKTTEGEWYSINDEELEEINAMGMTTEEKNSYFGAKNNIYTIKDEYEDLINEATEEEQDNLYTEQKRAIIDEVRNTNLTDEEKAYLYDRYYGNTDKLNVITETNIPFDTYLELEYQDFKADKNYKGQTISGSKKKKIMNFIESTGLDYNQKTILHKIYYPADDKYNYDIIDYVFNNVETYETRINILEALGFTIDENGVVHWK